VAEPRLTLWRDLVGAVSDDDGPDPVLQRALPLLQSLSGAAAALVLRPEGDSWVLTRSSGEDLPVGELASLLGAHPESITEAPATWVGVTEVASRRLPGHQGVLVLAWREERDQATGPALELLVTGLARIEAEERLEDLALRVDSAQMLADMGDYDWHIESDTNQWSDQLYRIYGHEPQAFNASYERFLSFVHPDDRARITEVHQRAYATGEPYAMIERIVRPDGEVRYLSSNGQVIMGPEGRPARMRGTCIDITDRVLAEQERERSAARFRNLVESSPDAVLVMDGQDVVVQANRRAHSLLGGDPLGHRFCDLVPPSPGPAGRGVHASGVDGSPLRLDVVMAELSHEAGDEGEVAAFLHDAAPRLRSEALAAALREGQVSRRQALEINDNVVQGLSTALYAMRDGDTQAATSLLERTLHAARRMMSDLLEPVEGEDISPGDLVRSTPSRLDGAKA
jgi:PAS domain S-box-containing protein